jgi:hypothetical protein
MAKDDWDAKVERAFRNRYRPTESLRDLIKTVQNNKGLRRVFSDLGTDVGFQKLLFAQPSDILAVEENFLVAFLPHASKTSLRKANKKGKLAITELINEESGGLPFQSVLGLNDDEWQKLASDVKEIVAYFIIMVVRNLPEVRAVVTADKFDYEQFRSSLKTVNEENLSGVEQAASALMEITKEVDASAQAIHPAIMAKVQDIGDLVMARFAKNIDNVGFDLNRVFPNIINQFHLVSDAWVTRILTRTKLSSAQYEATLDLLYRRDLLRTHSVMTWCMNCSIDNPTFSQRRGKIAPTRVSDSTCWSCQRREDFGAFYQIHEDLRKIMFYEDGLLAVYLGWLLDEAGLKYETKAYTKEAENDFIVNGSTLVEVKMFRAGRESRLVESSLKEAMIQLAKHTAALKKEGRQVKRAVLLWNGPSMPQKAALGHVRKHADAFEGTAVAIVGAEDASECVDELKESK